MSFRKDHYYPFANSVGQEIGRGWRESVVNELGSDWVLKTPHTSERNTCRQLLCNRADYEYLGDYLPRTYFLVGQDESGQPLNMAVQQRIVGASLRSIPDSELFGNDRLRVQLIDFLDRCVDLWDRDGRVPDLTGPKDNTSRIKVWYPRWTPNIVVENVTSRPYLVDFQSPPEYFSKDARFPFNYTAGFLANQVREFRDEVVQRRI